MCVNISHLHLYVHKQTLGLTSPGVWRESRVFVYVYVCHVCRCPVYYLHIHIIDMYTRKAYINIHITYKCVYKYTYYIFMYININISCVYTRDTRTYMTYIHDIHVICVFVCVMCVYMCNMSHMYIFVCVMSVYMCNMLHMCICVCHICIDK